MTKRQIRYGDVFARDSANGGKERLFVWAAVVEKSGIMLEMRPMAARDASQNEMVSPHELMTWERDQVNVAGRVVWTEPQAVAA